MTEPIDTDLPSLIRASGKVLSSKIPVVGALLQILNEAELRTRGARQEQWAAALSAGQDGDFASKLNGALKGEHSDVVRAAVLESARAAVEATDEAVIPAIGRLTHRWLTTKTPDLRTYRDLLTLLRGIDGEVFAAMAAVFQTIAAHVQGRGVQTAFLFDKAPEINTWNWYIVKQAPTGPQAVTLLTGDMAHRVVAALTGPVPVFAMPFMLPPPFFQTAMIDVFATTFSLE